MLILGNRSQALWDENVGDFDHEYYVRNQQVLDMHLLDEPMDSFEGRSVDAKVPCARIDLMPNGSFEATINHMVGGV